jgi:GTPase SAR1 family protein
MGDKNRNRFLEETGFWQLAPVYGRTEELNTLEQWILTEPTRLVTMFGLSGIGKTTLAVQLVTQIEDKFDEFDYIIWQSLRSSPPLTVLLTNLLKFLSNRQETDLPEDRETQLSLLMEYLREYRCLVILDDVHRILSGGELAGHYQSGYEEYGEFFRRLGEFYHNSCLLLLSWEPPADICQLEAENAPVRCLPLNGLEASAAVEIFREKELLDEAQWPDLIYQYRGHPFWLKIVASTIRDLFSGRVSELLKYESLFLDESFKEKLNRQLSRLSMWRKK